LAQKCSAYLSRSRAAEGRVESLAIIREIHRTGNVSGRPERFRGILAVVAGLAEASAAELFTPEGQTELPALAAALRRLPGGGEFFAYFDPPLTAEAAGAAGLSLHKIEETGSGARSAVRAEVLAGKEPVGFAELSLSRDSSRLASGGASTREILEAQLRSLELEPAGADQALEHHQLFRVHDASRGALSLSYPLMAEGAIIGAMRLAIPDDHLDKRDLTEVEAILQETAGHVGLVVKKDEDVERARRDGLTGLLLKVELFRDLREELSRAAAAAGGKAALLMIDIDHFKAVNDTHGHQTGDVVLKGVAACLAGHVRACDRAYRYGGEEMAVLLPGADGTAAARTAERLRRAVARQSFTAENGAPVPVTISVGLAEAAAAGAEVASPENMIERADQALYHSKEAGRNRCSAWRPEGPVELPHSRDRSDRRSRRETARSTPSAG
jgi:diguanylate cyclase (GGDEF)-like protein